MCFFFSVTEMRTQKKEKEINMEKEQESRRKEKEKELEKEEKSERKKGSKIGLETEVE